MIPEGSSSDDGLEPNGTHQPVKDGLEPEAIFRTMKEWYGADQAHSSSWRRQAKSDFEFVAGKQWDDNTRSQLEEEMRPVITFNRTLPMIKAVTGMEINSRHETVFMPRNTTAGEVRANEILTAASQWMADGCDAEDEQSEAFFDAVVCGMGWTECRIEYDEDPDGKYVEERIDPLEMVWDHTARAKNLQDAKRMFRLREMSLSEAREMFPDEHDVDLDAYWAMAASNEAGDPVPIEERRLKLSEADSAEPDQKVRIVHVQWYETEQYIRVEHPQTGEIIEVDMEQWGQYLDQLAETGQQPPRFVNQNRRVYKQAFLGGKILGEVKPALCNERFSFNCITGQPDRVKGTWVGLVDVIRDPQMWANKWLSQTLHILNTTAKGGILAEEDAFKNIRDAQDTYAQPDAITFTKKGAVSQGKIMQKPGVGLPQGYVNLLQFSVDSIPQVTGINMEMMGLRDVNQPGVLEAQRKQSAMTILAPLMDSKRRFTKNVGRCRLDLIQRYFSDGRLVRIAGKEGVQELRPLLQDETSGDYEVIVDDAPTSPNTKEQTWATIQQVMPVFKDMLTPEAVLTILEYSPLPSQLIGAFRDMMQKQPSPEEQEAMEFQKMAAISDERRKSQESAAKVEKDAATADQIRIKGIVDMINAGVKVADTDIKAAQAMMSEPPGGAPDTGAPDNGYAIEPDNSGIPSDMLMPQVPPMPTGGPAPGGPAQPQVSEVEDFLTRIRGQ